MNTHSSVLEHDLWSLHLQIGDMCTVTLNHQIHHHSTDCPVFLYVFVLYLSFPLLHLPLLLCWNANNQQRSATMSLFKVEELCRAFVALRKKKKKQVHMATQDDGVVWQLWPSGMLSCSYDKEVQSASGTALRISFWAPSCSLWWSTDCYCRWCYLMPSIP